MADPAYRKSLKQPDEFMRLLHSVVDTIIVRRREFIIGVVTIAGVLAMALLLSIFQEKRDRKAADAFERIMSTQKTDEPSAQVPEPSKLVDELGTFIQQNRRSSLVAAAQMYRGRAYLDLGKNEDALAAFRLARKKLSRPSEYLAMEGEAMALMELKRWSEAEAILLRLTKADDDPIRAWHLWNLGLVQEGGQRISQAIATFEELQSKYPNSPMVERAKSRLDALKSGPPKS